MEFHKMRESNGKFFPTHKKPFSPVQRPFKSSTVESVFNHAYDMTFGGEGEYRKYGRGIEEIFWESFEGKLGECGVCNYLHSYDSDLKPDFSVSGKGVWDSGDLKTKNGKAISVKATGSYSNLLLLKTKDYDSEGKFIPDANNSLADNGKSDVFVLVRISPESKKVFRSSGFSYPNNMDKDSLRESFLSEEWKYEITGYVIEEDVKDLISKGENILPKGALLGNTPMYSSNYYMQSGDLKDPSSLGEFLYG